MVLLPLIVLTQLLLPGMNNKPIFPFFRKVFMKKKAVEEKIRILEVEREVKDLDKKAKKLENVIKHN
jgi:hypothetical protein